ncbi:ATP-binding protein [Dongshaea marina]|uniref:ATP-binding protein n=1 Tax=Dongshaea marina TaxID=2047966 RepID=UPI000D3E526F|nr:ATP-binding protein [Dongshaea marina]
MIKRVLPQSLTGQIIIAALAGLLLMQLVNLVIYHWDRQEAVGYINSRNAVGRVASVVRLLQYSPVTLYGEILKASRSETLQLGFGNKAPEFLGEQNRGIERRLRKSLGYDEGLQIRVWGEVTRVGPGDDPDRADDGPGPWHHQQMMWGKRKSGQYPPPPPRLKVRFRGGIELPTGNWLLFRSMDDPVPPPWSIKATFGLLLVMLLVTLLVIVLLRRTISPMKRLALQADQFGRGESGKPLEAQGPREVRDMISAFNRMQDRLERFVNDRTRMLAAISHDLRTPLTSLRLRMEFMPDGDDKEKSLQTLAMMERMLNASLSFAREENEKEPLRGVDVTSLIESLCDDYSETGSDVSYRLDERPVIQCRPMALRRILQNLISNGIKYGERVEVGLQTEAGSLVIQVRDFGPGIPESQLQEVFKPFVRLDAARNIEDGHVGLGLSIAKTLVHQQGGELILKNHPEQGLIGEVRIPL